MCIRDRAYLLSATLVDLGSHQGWRIHGLAWGIAVMALSTYPYVFLLSTESFAMSGRRQLEACRSLGIGPWAAFRRVALPIALPAIGAGVALMGMEIVNELGAVQLLGIPSLSAGILEAWQAESDPTGAITLALITLVIVLTLVVCERRLRRRSRRWSDGVAGGDATAWTLQGPRALVAQLLTLIPPLLSLGTPLIWAATNLEQLAGNLEADLWQLSLRSLLLALAAAVLAVVTALLLAIANSRAVTTARTAAASASNRLRRLSCQRSASRLPASCSRFVAAQISGVPRLSKGGIRVSSWATSARGPCNVQAVASPPATPSLQRRLRRRSRRSHTTRVSTITRVIRARVMAPVGSLSACQASRMPADRLGMPRS